MTKIKLFSIKPYKIFWWCIPLFFIMGLFNTNVAFDIQMHDTYFVIALSHVWWLMAFVFFLLGYEYWWAKNKILNKTITFIHISLSFLLPLVIWLLIQKYFQIRSLGFHVNPPSEKTFILKQNYNWILISCSFWLITQLFMIIRLILVAVRK